MLGGISRCQSHLKLAHTDSSEDDPSLFEECSLTVDSVDRCDRIRGDEFILDEQSSDSVYARRLRGDFIVEKRWVPVGLMSHDESSDRR